MPGEARRLEKQALRRALRARRRALDPDTRARWSADLVEHLTAHDLWRRATVVASFLGMAGEPDTTPLVARAREAGKRLLLPRVESLDPPRMRFSPVSNVADLVAGRLGILEPTITDRDGELHACGVELVLVPGLAFGRDGSRLGQGGGFYDHALSRLSGVPRVGVVFGAWLDPPEGAPPMDEHDVHVDWVATERGVFPVSS
jgi:5-formyltetrahydrofolate cyclo-ligase